MPRNEEGDFELVLGNRQLLSGFFIVVILFAIFFSMGYIVGRHSSPAPMTAAANQDPAPLRAASPAGPPPGQAEVVAVEGKPAETPPPEAPRKPLATQPATAPSKFYRLLKQP